MEHSKNSSMREIYNNTGLSPDTRKIPNHLILHLKELEKTKHKLSVKEEIMKIRVEINEIDT